MSKNLTAVQKTEKLIKGQNATEIATEIVDDAKLALEIQIATQGGSIADAEKKVKQAKEELNKIMFNKGELISDRNIYISALISANQNVKQTENTLSMLKEVSEWLKEAKNELDN